MRPTKVGSIALALLAAGMLTTVGAWPAAAAPGDLDSSFGGGDGQVTTTFVGGAVGRAVAVQKDGKIVVAGAVHLTADDDAWAVVRYKQGGALDPTFGTNGRVVTNLTGNDDQAYDMALTGGGKLIVCGYAGSNFAAVRYLPDGHLDHSFSGDGKALVHFGSGPSYGYGLAKAPGGKIVLVGEVDNSAGDYRLGIARLTSGGTPDSSFGGGDGRVTTNLGTRSYAWDVLVRSDGSIVATGDANTTANTSVGMAWYRPNGNLDPDFGEGGTFVDDVGEDFSPSGMVQLGSGKIVVAGPYRTSPATFKVGLIRFRADGHPDETFGPSGLVTRDLGGTSNYPARMVRAGTKFVIGLGHQNGTQYHLGVVRLLANGAVDSGFGDQGLALSALNASTGNAVAVQGDGKIVVAGVRGATQETQGFLAARFLVG
jgi:uncharacterized delta-60 repeat protein